MNHEARCDAYDEGVRAYDEGKVKNPYPKDSELAKAWQNGWWEAESVAGQGFRFPKS
jgi:hypothetical protein